MQYDIIIIGGGLGGLECASLLSRRGFSTLVLEQAPQLGGSIQSYRRGVHSFDTGLHYVGGIDSEGSLYEAFSEFNLLSLPWQKMPTDGFDRVTIKGESYDFCQGFHAFAERMKTYFPDQSKGIDEFTSLMQRVVEAGRPQHATTAESQALQQQLTSINTWQYLHSLFTNERLINVLSGTSLKMELRRQTLPLFTFMHTLGGYIESSWKLKGSGQQIIDRLASDIHKHGGMTICNCHVVRLDEHDGRIIAAIDSNGQAYEGRMFISDIHPMLTMQLLSESHAVRKSYRNRLIGSDNTFGMFTVSLTMKPQTMLYHARNEYVYSTDDVWTIHEKANHVDGIMISEAYPTDETAYTQQVDLLAPMTWSTVEKWLGTRPLHRDDDYNQLKQQWAADCIALASSQIPEISSYDRIYTSTPLTWHDYTLAPQGTAYGMRKDASQPLTSMLSVRTPLPNLMLTGQNLMLHGLQGVSMTALITCKELTK